MYGTTSGDIVGDRPARQDDAPLLLTVPQAARLLNVGTTLCWEMVHGGQLPSVRLGRRVLVPRVAIERLARGEAV